MQSHLFCVLRTSIRELLVCWRIPFTISGEFRVDSVAGDQEIDRTVNDHLHTLRLLIWSRPGGQLTAVVGGLALVLMMLWVLI